MWAIEPGINAYSFGLECVAPGESASADAKKEFYDAVLRAMQEKGYKTFDKKVAIIARVQRSTVKGINPGELSKTLLEALHNWRKVNQFEVQVGPRRLIERDSSAYVASFTVEMQRGPNRVEYFIWEVGPAVW